MSDTKISEACERCGRCRVGDFKNCKNARRLAEASKDALPFVAYAYSQGIEGAEEAGRAVETALNAEPLHPQPAELAEQQGYAPIDVTDPWRGLYQAARLPEGEWRLAWKGDTEYGPYAWFVRPMALRPEPAALAATGKQQVDRAWSLHDRVEFALRDAGFDLDEASRIALLADRQQVGEVQGDALLPCPFCGSEDAEMQQCQAEHYVQCLECEGATALFSSRREARELWNRRVTLAARQPVGQEPVAVVGSDFTICWVGSGPIAPLVERHGIKRGSLLYAAPPAQGIDLGSIPDGWSLRTLATCYQLSDGNQVVANLVGPDAERNAQILASLIHQRDAAPGVGNG